MWSPSMGTRLARKETGEKHSFFLQNISLDCCWQTKSYNNYYNCLLFFLESFWFCLFNFFLRE